MTREEAIARGNQAIGALDAILGSSKPNREIEDDLDARDAKVTQLLTAIFVKAKFVIATATADSPSLRIVAAKQIQKHIIEIREMLKGTG